MTNIPRTLPLPSSSNLSILTPPFLVFHGTFIVPTKNPFRNCLEVGAAPECVEIKQNHLMLVDTSTGKITYFAPDHTPESQARLHIWTCPLDDQYEYIKLAPTQMLSPGFIDLHIHAPQYSYTGTATDRPLMGPDGWLERYTFPAERSLNTDDLRKAHDVYSKVVSTTVKHGTTTALYFATLHVKPTKVLCDVASDIGQRALIGKVCMDRNCPEDYCETTEENLRGTEDIVQYIRNSSAGRNGLLMPVITPRFIPTCTPELLSGLAVMARRYDCHIQSHVSESIDEVAFSRFLDEKGQGRSDTVVFDSLNCLTAKTVLAHGVFVDDDDADILRTRGCAIGHCPLSNFYFAGRALPCRHLMQRGNKVGLGTDVAGGYSPSMLNSCRSAVIASKSLWQAKYYANEISSTSEGDDTCSLTYKHAYYLATLGGAEALGLDNEIGTFRVGFKFDAILFSAMKDNIHVFSADTVEDIFQKLCCLGDDRNVERVYVQGRRLV
mmetsp:Transcript_7669/g.11271  ORF Transcript_7669/g.11271 Transcript_7669/m.11271 type:complete len:495 (+) Transcript_7669:19-1503(+)